MSVRRLLTGVVTTVVAAGVVTVVPTAAHASGDGTVVASAAVAALRTQLRTHGLAVGHGVVDPCADAGLACGVQVVTTGATSTQPLVSSVPIGYGPDDLQQAYDIPAASTGRGLIAVVISGADPALESDAAVYRARFGMTPCTSADGCFRQVNYQGGPAYPPAPAGRLRAWEQDLAFEATLDVEMAMAGCPGCRVVEIQTEPGDLFRGGVANAKTAALHIATAVQTAKRLGAEVVTMSVTLPSYRYTDRALAAMMTTPGTALVAASGDGGDLPNPEWPQNLPTVTSVGGTSLYRDATTARGWSEVAWHGAGSSCAYDLPPAVGQPASVSGVCGGHRASSDISAVADPYTGVAMYISYSPSSGTPVGWEVVGGTSAAAPFVAGLYARAPQRPGVTGPDTVYAAPASAFHDVTIGTTSGVDSCGMFQPDPLVLCNARRGWDGPTGRGTPNGLGAL